MRHILFALILATGTAHAQEWYKVEGRDYPMAFRIVQRTGDWITIHVFTEAHGTHTLSMSCARRTFVDTQAREFPITPGTDNERLLIAVCSR